MENLYSLAARTNRSSFEEIGEENINEEKKLWGCLPLYRALLRENQSGFEKEAKALSKFPPDVTICRKVTRAGDTGLHVLVGAGKWYDSVISKPKSYALEGLVIRNNNGHTPLCVAAKVGNMEAAKKLLQLETEIRSVRATDDDTVGRYPIIEAARYGHKEMVLLWIGDMATKMADSPPTKESAASTFLHLLVVAEFYDVLLALVRRFPGLARAEFYGDNDDVSLLSLMAETPSAFRSGTQLGFWQRLLYSVAQANLERRLSDIEKSFVVNQPSVTVPSTESPQPTNELTWECFVKYPRNCVITIQAWLARMINRAAIFKHIKDIKLMHKETLDIVKRLCKELMKEYKPKDIEPVLRKAVLLAASSGIPEIIEEIVDCYPDAIWFVNSENHNLFHLAVINRHEKVFNFIYQLSLYKHLVTTDEDTSGNNILHMAGKLAPLGRLNLISGAALQMQRELQWFQEVEKFVHPTLRTNRNSYGKTPKMVFTEEHKELVKEGEKWMKETANSCTFVAALTATVGFAAAITVPGGNQSKGFPIFSKEPAFTIFAVSVAFCLFSSVASVLMFLLKFEDYFANRVKQLIFTFPEDAMTSSGAPFWSAPKRFPHPLQFSSTDPSHLHFIMAASILRAETFGIPIPDWAKHPKKLSEAVDKVMVPDFQPKKDAKIVTDEKATSLSTASIDDAAVIDELISKLEHYRKNLTPGFRMKPIQFEKDDDTNYHMDLIAALANMRARNYSIPEVDKLKAKFIAGRIIPAIATTTAMATGLVCLELYKVLDGGHKLEDYRNTFANLALPLFSMAEPVPPKVVKHQDMSWTVWDRWVIKDNPTLRELIQWLADKGLNAYSISCGSCLLFNSMFPRHKERMDKKVVDLARDVAKVELPPYRRHLDVVVACEDDEDNDVDIPLVSVYFR